MIGFLSGRLLRKAPQELLLDVSGVGYRVLVPVSTFCRLGPPGDETRLHIHTHVREDQITLFGFATPLEQEIFERLLAVSGVGPKVALGVLSGIEPEELVQALRANDIARLTRIPGIGKKTAERLLLELRDRIAGLAVPTTAPALSSPAREDLASALANLGYSPSEVERAVAATLKAHPDAPLGELLREALRAITRR